jgi:lipid II:glycine glycyltransferase (peptidoglycan interpeptide bridge formation enzyme)
MKLTVINQEQLNGFLLKQKHSEFLQSWEWGEFQKRIGNKVFRFGIEEDGKLLGGVTLIKKELFCGYGYFYAPRMFNLNHEFLFAEIRKLAKEEKCVFLRYEPNEKLEVISKNLEIGKGKFEIVRTIPVQPEKSLILDIDKSEDELLRDMHKKTRYNIRLAERNGIRVETLQCNVSTDTDFEQFWKIMKETQERDGFRLHGKEHYRKMLFESENKKSDLQFKLFLAKYENKIIAGSIVAFFGNTATYVHGASSNKHRNLMAPYGLQWQSIKTAKELGCRFYDFFGIDEEKWPGVTRFKKGFGGEAVDYPGTFDLVFDSFKYRTYNILRRARRIINFS